MQRYHDLEWGKPSRDDRHMFEMLVLEGAQAGLSWATILAKRENYRSAFDDFDPLVVARYGDGEVERLLADPGIVRNRLKIRSAIANAGAFLAVQAECGSFADYIWAWTGGSTIRNLPEASQQVPARTELSDAVSKDLRKRGFGFVGSTIVYSFLQSVGIVDDHLTTCSFKTEG
jgi:DNA-3-methyladenine glycosylase I